MTLLLLLPLIMDQQVSDTAPRFRISQRMVAWTMGAFLLGALAIGLNQYQKENRFQARYHQKISINGPVQLSFAEPMDHQSVLEQIILPDGMTGTPVWTDEGITIPLESSLTKDVTYTIVIPATTLKDNGSMLGRDLVYNFTVTGAPIVSARIPTPDSANTPTDAEIIIVFDRPIVPLAQVQGDDAQGFTSWPVTITPQVKGTWKWLGTTTARFIPDQPLDHATTYTIHVPSGIKLVGEQYTEEDFSWNFHTIRPSITHIEPVASSALAGPTSIIKIHSSHEMNVKSMKEKTLLTEQGQNQKDRETLTIQDMKYDTIIDDHGKKITDKTTLIVVPEQPLNLDSSYTLTVQSGALGIIGTLGTSEKFESMFHTAGPLRVVHSEFENGAINIDMSSVISTGALLEAMHSTPNVSMSGVSISWYETMRNDQVVARYTFYPALQPSTNYTIQIKDLVDIYGQKLAQPHRLQLRTPPVPTRVFLHPESKKFSIFERGKTPIYYLNQINTKKLLVEFGPISIDSFLRYQREEGSHDWSDPSWPPILDSWLIAKKTKQIQPKAKQDAWEAIPLDIEKEFGELAPGIYALSVSSPEWVSEYLTKPEVDRRFFAVTNLATTLKYSGQSVLIWVADMQTGEAVQGANIELRSLDGKVIKKGKTDADGMFRESVNMKDFGATSYQVQPQFWAVIQKGDDTTFIASDWSQGIEPWSFNGGIYSEFRSSASPRYRVLSSIYTDRPLYKAGDTVEVKGILRFLDNDGSMEVVDKTRQAVIRITNPEGTEVLNTKARINDYGSFHLTFPTPQEASLGTYFIEVGLNPSTDVTDENWYGGVAYGNFQILAYRKPEYKVSVTPKKEEYFDGEKLSGTIDGYYYFGAPMRSADVTWNIRSDHYYFNKYTKEWYTFGLEDSWCFPGSLSCSGGSAIITEGKGKLNEAGRLEFSAQTNLEAHPVSQIYSIEANITDESNQTVSAFSSVIVHKSDTYVGLLTNEYGAAKGENIPVQFITLTPEGSPQKQTRIDVEVFSRTWNTIKEKGVDGEYYYTNEPKDTFLSKTSLWTDDEGKGIKNILLEQEGELRIVATVKDKKGRMSKAGISVYAFGEKYYQWPRSNTNKVEVLTDRPSYNIGDTARLIVKNPYQGKGVKALITVEREDVHEVKLQSITGSMLPISIPITEAHIPTVYVSVTILKPRIGETFNEHGLDTGAPAFVMGYARLDINPESKKINLSLETDAKKYTPGSTVKVKIKATDAAHKPVQADLSLGVVDQSVLDLAGFALPNLIERFYNTRSLGVYTSTMLTYLMERFKPGSKGGGGGEDRTRGNFKDTAYWNPTIETDKNGEASVAFVLPDNLTTWQLLAIGSTKNHLFGAEARTIIETKNVIVRPVLPRFAVQGDVLELGAIVHNFLDEEKTFTVSLTGSGFTSNEALTQTVTLKPDEEKKMNFTVQIEPKTEAIFTMEATTNGAKDKVLHTIPVYPFGIVQTNATSGKLNEATETSVTEVLAVPSKNDASTGSLTVTIAPSLAMYLPEALSYVSNFIYDCSEQVMSGILPNIALHSLAKFKDFSHYSSDELEKKVTVGLQKLYKNQRSDGGFGYYDSSIQSYPWLTAYILHGLTIAKNSGFGVDGGVTQKAVQYLEDEVRRGKNYLDTNTKAYVHYVLTYYGRMNEASLNTLVQEKSSLNLVGTAYTILALHQAKQEAKAKMLTKELLAHIKVNARGAHFEEIGQQASYASMNSDATTTAIILKAIIATDPKNPLIEKLLRGMIASRHDGHWDTTQSTAQSILTLVDYLQKTNELNVNQEVSVLLNDKEILATTQVSGSLSTLTHSTVLKNLPAGKSVPLHIAKNGKGSLYYDASLQYFYTPETIEPIDQGIGITRDTISLDPKEKVLKTKSVYQVTLTMTVPETRHFVAVESMLPAGFELIDFSFATTQQSLQENVNQLETWSSYFTNQLWRFSHIEMRDDRVFLFAEELPAGVYKYQYLVRATQAGKQKERPARIWEMYNPENFGQTEGKTIEIQE